MHRTLAVDREVLVVGLAQVVGADGDLRELGDVEEVGRTQVLVALRFLGVERGRVDRRRDPPRCEIRSEDELAGEGLERAADGRDAEVLDGEPDGRWARSAIQVPAGFGLVRRDERESRVGTAGLSTCRGGRRPQLIASANRWASVGLLSTSPTR
jgi:hypothetical protein